MIRRFLEDFCPSRDAVILSCPKDRMHAEQDLLGPCNDW